MKIIAITHAEKGNGANPGLTEAGKEKIRALIVKLPEMGLTNVIIGTGRRFMDVFYGIMGGLNLSSARNLRYSPLLGSADSGQKTESGFEVRLADGTVVQIGDYIGIIGTPGIDLWTWLKSLQEGTVLCTGREFIGALGVSNAQMAQVYQIDTDTMTVIVL